MSKFCCEVENGLFKMCFVLTCDCFSYSEVCFSELLDFKTPKASDPRKSLATLAFWPIFGYLLGSVFHTSEKAL